MVVVVIRSPLYDEESGDQVFRERAKVIATGKKIEIEGERTLVAEGALPVIDISTGKQVHAADDAEAWARNLPHAFRAGDLIAEILCDTSPSTGVKTNAERREPPKIPSPTDMSSGQGGVLRRISFGH